jgi:hypothetical protein
LKTAGKLKFKGITTGTNEKMKANTVWIAENLIAMASDQKDGVGSYNRIISKEEKHMIIKFLDLAGKQSQHILSR